MPSRLIVVKAARDEESGVWFVESSDLPGLNVEGDTLEALIEKLPAAVRDLVEEAGSGDESGYEVPIEIVAHASTRIRIPDAA